MSNPSAKTFWGQHVTQLWQWVVVWAFEFSFVTAGVVAGSVIILKMFGGPCE